MNPTSFPNLDLPVVDPQTGRINKAWYQLLASMYLLLGGSDPVSTPDLAVLNGLMDENFSETMEIAKALDDARAGLAVSGDATPMLGELQKRLEDIGQQSAAHDGLAALVGEVSKTLTDMQAQISIHMDTNGRLAELEKRLNDMEVVQSFTDRPYGSMAFQDYKSITITGGSINGVTIGAGGAAPATFSTVTSNNSITIGEGNIIVPSGGRNYLGIRGSTGAGGVEFSTSAADGDATLVGIMQWADVNSTNSDKRIANINAVLSGSTTNNRGSYLAFSTKKDGGAMTEAMRISNGQRVLFGTTTDNGTDLGQFNGPIIATQLKTTQTPTASTTATTHSIPIVCNGTTYYMRLSATA